MDMRQRLICNSEMRWVDTWELLEKIITEFWGNWHFVIALREFKSVHWIIV